MLERPWLHKDHFSKQASGNVLKGKGCWEDQRKVLKFPEGRAGDSEIVVHCIRAGLGGQAYISGEDGFVCRAALNRSMVLEDAVDQRCGSEVRVLVVVAPSLPRVWAS